MDTHADSYSICHAPVSAARAASTAHPHPCTRSNKDRVLVGITVVYHMNVMTVTFNEDRSTCRQPAQKVKCQPLRSPRGIHSSLSSLQSLERAAAINQWVNELRVVCSQLVVIPAKFATCGNKAAGLSHGSTGRQDEQKYIMCQPRRSPRGIHSSSSSLHTKQQTKQQGYLVDGVLLLQAGCASTCQQPSTARLHPCRHAATRIHRVESRPHMLTACTAHPHPCKVRNEQQQLMSG
jgi:hypothetical protein